MVHSTDNYTIGKAVVKIASIGVSPSFVELGNCPSVAFSIEEERLEHFSSRGGLKNRDLYPLIQLKYTLTFECDEITDDNLQKFVKGTKAGAEIYGFQDPNTEWAIQVVEDNPLGPNRTWNFWRGVLSANGELATIGDDWKKVPLKFEGLADEVNHAGSPYFTIEGTSTTTT